MIIDIHGHYTTAPKALEMWRNRQIAGIKNPSEMSKASELRISDNELRDSIESNQLRLMRERGLDLTIFSPRASFMAHHIGDFQVSSTWAAIYNVSALSCRTISVGVLAGATRPPRRTPRNRGDRLRRPSAPSGSAGNRLSLATASARSRRRREYAPSLRPD
jgi:hypothetical protein